MVHRTNKELATQCSSLPAGQSREIQRSKATAQVDTERADARKARKRQDKDDVRVRRIRANIGETSLIKSRNDLVATQLQLYNNNKSSFVAAMGVEAYDNKIIELLSKLPDPEKVQIGCAAGDNDDKEDDDDDDASDV
jgi:thymidine kinase